MRRCRECPRNKIGGKPNVEMELLGSGTEIVVSVFTFQLRSVYFTNINAQWYWLSMILVLSDYATAYPVEWIAWE